jgi:hypothetical protein
MNAEIILLFISGILLAIGAYQWQRGSRLVRDGKKAKAMVIDNHEEDGRQGGCYYPIVVFTTDDNKEVGHKLNFGYSSPMEKGAIIDIVYDPEEPTIIELDSRATLEVVPRVLVIAGICGFVFVLFEIFEITHLLN